MSERTSEERRRQALSELMDGEAGPSALFEVCAEWRRDAAMRADWHAYHLIGDVLRSDDLALPAAHDEVFLGRLRDRLAAEPVVLAPGPAPAAEPSGVAPARRAERGWRRGWAAPVAVAAGFVAVAGVLVVTRVAAPDLGTATGSSLAAVPGSAAVQQASLPEAGGNDALVTADRKLIRDARLDRYLAAHKQFGGSSALAVPGVVLRSATTVSPER